MMRSLFSGISGLRNHQTRMDVIGNNIANVNTAGYKTSRVVFQDIFSQTMAAGQANTGIQGGTNPIQIGLGIRLSSIDILHTRSAFSSTGSPTDMMIDGDGFFILGVENEDGSGYDRLYTRAGNFSIDNDGFLVSSHGFFVMGWQNPIVWGILSEAVEEVPAIPPVTDPGTGDIITPGVPGTPGRDEIWGWIDNTGGDPDLGETAPRFGRIYVGGLDFGPDGDFGWDWPSIATGGRLPNFSVSENGSISVLANNRELVIGQIEVAVFSNPAGLTKAGSSLFIETASSGPPNDSVPGLDGAGIIMGGGLEMSNVDLANEFTDMIVTQRGFQANSRIITVSDTMLEELVNLKR
ncbi:MAG: flagellar hook-basal body complex protein [Oscillospiraceae bacterium]|nr:flagellar hook-basal body complex protein [Oscillospiraceae bacterium]